MFKLTCQALFGAGKIENPALLAAIGDFNFLYATGILFLASAALMVIGSLTAPAPQSEKIDGMTYTSIRALYGEDISKSWDWGNKAMSSLILILVGAIYLYFSFWTS
jgi:SSS family solute:Na+ symporter